MEEIKAYKPKCCSKAYMTKSGARKHKKKCFKNPDNKACLTCKYFIKDYNTVYVPPRGDSNYGDDDYEEPYYFCDFDGKTLMSVHIKPMKLEKHYQSECEHWELKEGD
ncbi:hypothetical protein C8E03_108123 [Lachnotalea glycerini]|uniref:Uncharacterized protein n=1 Tax=Lachnotalea glycerini TaxID=1763509 RepID=A0A318ELJ2_9FIRM|nr:hypothetical protein [Lachnotalea glycerini]PXV88396.1 hypothetical protein C8E03_108123 [Lachnotalea glycerini]